MMRVLQRWENRKRDRARILQIADDVEANAGFDMRTYYHDCGTPSCIAGFAHARAVDAGMADVGETTAYRTSDAASEYLGIPQARALFSPRTDTDGVSFMSGGITSAHAAACLRKLAKTGEIDWRGTKP